MVCTERRDDLIALARTLEDDSDRAEDLVAGAFLRGLSHAECFRTAEEAYDYLAIAIRNGRRDVWRHGQVVARAESLLVADPLRDSPRRPDEVLRERMRSEGVDRAIAVLPPKQQAAILLTYWRGCSYDETAAVLDRSPRTVQENLRRAKARLKEDPTLEEIAQET